ncbi:MAG: hypothetical protein IJL74_03225 [Bacilli bacterium]|nr:hypothetical protein [Bacilli bacterium]
MDYIYDILLNFNEDLIEFFEWDDNDNIKYIKKIMLFKVDEQIVKDIVNNTVLLSSNFTNSIPKYEINNIKEKCKLCLLTDGNIVIGLLIENNVVKYISRLLLDEEYEILLSLDSLDNIKIDYKIIKNRIKKDNTLTRTESKIKELLLVELDSLYKDKDINKLIYLYYEFTNKESKDFEYIYNYLKKSLNSFCSKHIHIYNILSMCNTKTN